MKQLILIFLILMPYLLFSKQMKGYVYNQKNEPLELVLALQGKDSAYTDDLGYFVLNTKSKLDTITFYQFGYDIAKMSVEDFKIKGYVKLNPKEFMLEGITFKAKRYPTFLPKSKEKVVIVIDENDKSMDNVADVISNQSSIDIKGTQLPGERQTASILGHKSRHTLVMLDGIAMNSNGEDFDLSAIPTEIVDEIEIYKNNASSLSGAGGIAGAINIKTKKSSSNSGEVTLNAKYGSFDYRKVTVSTGQSFARSNIYVVLSAMETNNDFKYKIKKGNNLYKLTRENNRKSSKNIMLNYSAYLNFMEIAYSNNSSIFDNQLPGPTNFTLLYDNAFIKGYDSYNSLKLSKKTSSVNNNLTFYSQYKKSKYDNTNPTMTNNLSKNTTVNDKRGTKLENVLEKNNLSFILTNEYIEDAFSFDEETDQISDIPRIKQFSTASGLIAKYEQDLDLLKFGLTTSGRYEKNNGFGGFTTYRIGGEVTHDYLIKTSLTGSIGTGFTLPSFYSLYWKGDTQAMGNPDLKPEESEGYQSSLEFEYARSSIKIGYSFNKIDNLIQWVEVQLNGKVWKPINIGSSEIENFSIEADLEPTKNLKFYGSYVVTKTKNLTVKENGEPTSFYNKELAYTPDEQIKVGGSYEYKGFKIGAEYSKTGKQWITLDNLKDPLPSYELTNVMVSKSFKAYNLEHNITVNFNNVFNEYYEIYSYNPEAPFNWNIAYNLCYKL